MLIYVVGGSSCNPIDLGVLNPGDQVRNASALNANEPSVTVPCEDTFTARWYRFVVSSPVTVVSTVCSNVVGFTVLLDGMSYLGLIVAINSRVQISESSRSRLRADVLYWLAIGFKLHH